MSEDREKYAKTVASIKAAVLHPFQKNNDQFYRDPDARLQEAVGLALAINLNIVLQETVAMRAIRPSTLLGVGIVEQYKGLFAHHGIEVVIIDGALSPVQQRNLEKAWKCKVIDRTGLILEIFGERARTAEGRLQVELASLTYQKSRLVKSWTHLERQRGGTGFIGGPGETQLEVDRRLLTNRITKLKKELEKVKRTRELHRKARRQVPYPIVALVGYTNAGKSTLFNQLTKAEVMAEDQLFATLDPTMRLVKLASGREVIFSDTVGFISDLPTQLVAAFRATLEEVLEADLLLHVRDVSHMHSDQQAEDVELVLKELGLEEKMESSLIEVHNKIDLLPKNEEGEQQDLLYRYPVSALTGVGLEELLRGVDTRLGEEEVVHTIELHASQGAELSWLYSHGDVLSIENDEEFIKAEVKMSTVEFNKFRHHFGIMLELDEKEEW